MPLTISTIAVGTPNCCSACRRPFGLIRSNALLQSKESSSNLPALSSSAASINLLARNNASLVPRRGLKPY
eukprot:9502199-Pyramimonas_sp.AAC.1